MHKHHPESELSIETVIKETAKHYQLYNLSLGEACDINSAVARSLGQHQAALTWTVLKTVHSGAVTRSDRDLRPLSGDNVGDNGHDNTDNWRQRLRTSSFGTTHNRKLSSKQNAVSIDINPVPVNK